jgi:hypothetical protein
VHQGQPQSLRASSRSPIKRRTIQEILGEDAEKKLKLNTHDAATFFDNPDEKNRIKKAVVNLFKIDKVGSNEIKNMKVFGMLPH